MNPVTGRPCHPVEMVCLVDPDSPVERGCGEIPVCPDEMVCLERGERTPMDEMACLDELDGLEILDEEECLETGVKGV